KIFYETTAVCLQATAEVVNLKTQNSTSHRIGKSRKKYPGPVIVSDLPPPDHYVESLVDFFKKSRDVGRIILQVGVEEKNNIALCDINTSVYCRRLPIIALQAHEA